MMAYHLALRGVLCSQLSLSLPYSLSRSLSSCSAPITREANGLIGIGPSLMSKLLKPTIPLLRTKRRGRMQPILGSVLRRVSYTFPLTCSVCHSSVIIHLGLIHCFS